MLTDPEVRKSPCSVLTPLRRPKFTEDFSQQKLPAPDRMDQGQSYIPGYTGEHLKESWERDMKLWPKWAKSLLGCPGGLLLALLLRLD